MMNKVIEEGKKNSILVFKKIEIKADDLNAEIKLNLFLGMERVSEIQEYWNKNDILLSNQY